MVILREICEEDTSNIVKWRNSVAVKSNLFTQTDLTEEQHLNWLHNYVKVGLCKQYIISVVDHDLSVDIGTTFIKNIDYQKKEGEFGMFIGDKRFRGGGHSYPAAKLIVEIAFSDLNLDRLYLSVIADNIPAIKTYKKLGFKTYNINKNGFLSKGNLVDVIQMDIKK